MATPFPTTGTQEGDIAAGLIQNGVYNPNIDVSKITPTDSIKLPSLPETDNYSAILASLKGSLPPEPDTSAIEKGQKDILSLMSEQGKESAFRAEQEGAAGVNIDKKALADLQAQLNAVNTEAMAATLNVDRPDQPTKLTAGAILDKGVIERDRTIKALRLSSSIQAMQGNLSLAIDQADRAVKLKYDPLKNEIDVLNKQLEFNYKNFNAAEKKRADALQEVNDLKMRELDQKQDAENTFNKVKIEALINGLPPAIAQRAETLFNNNQPDQAYAVLSNYAGVESRQVGGGVLTQEEATKLGLPSILVGKSEAEINRDLSSETPPVWFKDLAEQNARASLVPSYLLTLWKQFQTTANTKTTAAPKTSNSGSVDYGAFNLPPPTK